MTDSLVAEIRRWPRETAVEIENLQKSVARLTAECARLRKALEETKILCDEALKERGIDDG